MLPRKYQNMIKAICPDLPSKPISRVGKIFSPIFEAYPLDVVFDMFPIPVSLRIDKKYHFSTSISLHGHSINTNSTRLRLFYRDRKKLHCVTCGLPATHWALEGTLVKGKKIQNPHFNLYGLQEEKDQIKEILFTKDHIIPDSKGGSGGLTNMQIMCTVCNTHKGDGIRGSKKGPNNYFETIFEDSVFIIPM